MHFLMVALFISSLQSSYAQQVLKITITGREYSEYYDEGQYAQVSERWLVETDQWGDRLFRYSGEVSTENLPFKICMIDSCAEISRKGKVSMGGYWGDMDIDSYLSSQLLVTADNTFLFGVEPYRFSVKGGEYAAGNWGMKMNMVVELK
jgi:hypothetical protein